MRFWGFYGLWVGSPAAGFECGLNGVCSGVGEMGEKCPILALGLRLGLQLGVTLCKNRGYTFGDFAVLGKGGELTILK